MCVCVCRKQDVVEILKDYGKQNITIKSVARVLGQLILTVLFPFNFSFKK